MRHYTEAVVKDTDTVNKLVYDEENNIRKLEKRMSKNTEDAAKKKRAYKRKRTNDPAPCDPEPCTTDSIMAQTTQPITGLAEALAVNGAHRDSEASVGTQWPVVATGPTAIAAIADRSLRGSGLVVFSDCFQ